MISIPRLFTKHCMVFSVFNDTLVRRVRVTERLHFLQGVYLRSSFVYAQTQSLYVWIKQTKLFELHF